MKFATDDDAIKYILSHQDVPKQIIAGRKEARELYALIEGDEFKEELIHKIEHIESQEKAIARKRYSRPIVDLYERILQPISNVFSASGGSKAYAIDNEAQLKVFLNKISHIRDGKTIQKYIQDDWMPLYHVDPNGLIFMEYKTEAKHGVQDIYPTYKSINTIRAYEPKGQLVDVVLFEPKKVIVRDEYGNSIRTDLVWRIVDDVKDRTIRQNGSSFVIDEGATFEHPFGQVPAIINSNIVKTGVKDYRISPIHKIKEASKEYARDQSVKTLYKFLQGFPIHWRYVTQCKSCQGTAKKGDGKCPDCDGKGFYMKKDVTDIVTLPAPKKSDDVKLAPDIAGYVSPDLETWGKYSEELKDAEILMMDTHWGTHKEKEPNETATGRYIDVQPVINRLNKYSDVAEWVEKQISEWVYRFYNPGKLENIASINYGRRFIIESADQILEKYNTAREKGANSVILDRLYNEYLTSKYNNDPQWLRQELLKSEIEPYIHNSIEEISTVFGAKEAQRKVSFVEWWKTLDEKAKTKPAEALRTEFQTWFDKNTVSVEVPPPTA